jgi:hypothetical protein
VEAGANDTDAPNKGSKKHREIAFMRWAWLSS